MTQSLHQEIRRLIATSADDLSEAQQALLHAHLQDCGSCREYAAATAEIVYRPPASVRDPCAIGAAVTM